VTRIVAHFDTRRAADLTLEHLVQEHGIDRTKVVLQAAGDDNTTGEQIAGADHESGAPSRERRSDSPLHGPVELSVDLDDDRVEAVCSSLRETGAQEVSVL
jgi:hypothetical protein